MDHEAEVTRLDALFPSAKDLQLAEQSALESSEEQWARHASDVELRSIREDARLAPWQNPLNDF